jgi:HK97 family phage major capsid protein
LAANTRNHLGRTQREFRSELFARNRSSYDEYRSGEAAGECCELLALDDAPALFNEPEEFLEQTELRVLSKAASGGGFCVPDDVANMVISAGRSVSPIAQLAQEFVTQRGEVLGVPIAGTHGVASWVAESGAITPSDETITR